jgi:hypothetical protein
MAHEVQGRRNIRQSLPVFYALTKDHTGPICVTQSKTDEIHRKMRIASAAQVLMILCVLNSGQMVVEVCRI